VGIVGPTCSGKSALAEAMWLEAREQVIVLPHDDYYLDRTGLSSAVLAEIDFDHPDALDLALLTQHVRQLRAGAPIQKPVYSRHSHRRLTGQMVTPRPIIVVEGLFLFGWPELAREFDLKVFIDQGKETIVKRRLQRDAFDYGRNPVEVAANFHERIWPGYLRHIEPMKDLADLVIADKFDLLAAARKVLVQARARLKQSSSAAATPEPTPATPEWDLGVSTGGLVNSAPAE
jgi:uridine kinase